MKLSAQINTYGVIIFTFIVITTLGKPAQACGCQAKKTAKAKVITPAKTHVVLPILEAEQQSPLPTRAEGERKINFRHNVYVDGDIIVNKQNTLYAATLGTASGTSTTITNDLAIHPCRKILTNTIGPVYLDANQQNNNQPQLDPNGTTYCTGNLGLAPHHTFFTNEIAPVRSDITACSNTALIATCAQNNGGTTSFSGNVAIKPSPYPNNFNDESVNTLYVNQIAPLMIDTEGICQQNNEGSTLFLGNVSLDEGKSLHVNGPLYLNGRAYITDTLTMAPTTPLLTNNISPMQPDNLGGYTTDPEGTINIKGNVVIQKELNVSTIRADHTLDIMQNTVIAPSKTLSVDRIESSSDKPIILNQTVCIGSTRHQGHSPLLHLISESPTSILRLAFNVPSNSQEIVQSAQGAMVRITLQGLGWGHDQQNIPVPFDFFTEFTVLVGPGRTFQNTVCSHPTLYYGHTSPYHLQALDISFATLSDTSVAIQLTPRHESTTQFTLDFVEAIVTYDVIGAHTKIINESSQT